jgi:probable FeS assembly SUF system protein SufT
MPSFESVVLVRDCEGILIPMGEPFPLKAGETVRITQALGGSFTVEAQGRLVRLEARDADALGNELSAQPKPPLAPDPNSPAGPLDEKLVWDQLKSCYDPEIPVNIVDLGLVYDLQISPTPEGLNQVDIKMTLTAPGCSMGGVIAQEAETKIRALPGVADVRVELVWDPPWNQAMLTEAARLQLGLM